MDRNHLSAISTTSTALLFTIALMSEAVCTASFCFIFGHRWDEYY